MTDCRFIYLRQLAPSVLHADNNFQTLFNCDGEYKLLKREHKLFEKFYKEINVH